MTAKDSIRSTTKMFVKGCLFLSVLDDCLPLALRNGAVGALLHHTFKQTGLSNNV